MSADRERFICQSSSNNRYYESPSISLLTKSSLLSWSLGIKTAVYYTRTKAINTGKKLLSNNTNNKQKNIPEDEECLSCSA